MDLGNNSIVKTPEDETDTPTRMLPAKPSPFTNGVLKRHQQPSLVNHHNHQPVVVNYRECLKNHAASLGGHAVDGCGEFMPSPNANPAEPTSLKCAACGCHRNFHRREPDDPPPNDVPALEYHPLHRHHPPPPQIRQGNSSGSPTNSPSPPPISSSYYPSAPHTLLALSHGFSGPPPENSPLASAPFNPATAAVLLSSGSRKRFRTKFTQYQKEKMLELAEKVEWKMQKKDEDLINESCSDMGVDKGVFKVWMHNNKNSLGKNDHHHPPPEITPPPPPPPPSSSSGAAAGYSHDDIQLNNYHLHNPQAPANGSSSSS